MSSSFIHLLFSEVVTIAHVDRRERGPYKFCVPGPSKAISIPCDLLLNKKYTTFNDNDLCLY